MIRTICVSFHTVNTLIWRLKQNYSKCYATPWMCVLKGSPVLAFRSDQLTTTFWWVDDISMSLEFERVLFRRSVLLVNVAPPSVDNPNEILSSPVIFENEKTYTFLAEISEEAIAKFGWNFFLPSNEISNIAHTTMEVVNNITSINKAGCFIDEYR